MTQPKPNEYKNENDEIDWEAYNEAADDYGDAKYEQWRDERDEREDLEHERKTNEN